MKFPTPFGIGKARGDQKTARVLYLDELKKNQEPGITTPETCMMVVHIEMESYGESFTEDQMEPTSKAEDVELEEGNTEKTVKIGMDLDD